MAGYVQVRRERLARVAHAVVLHHTRPHHELGIDPHSRASARRSALGLVVDDEAIRRFGSGCRRLQRKPAVRRSACIACEVQHVALRLLERPFMRAAPLLARGSVDRPIVDGRLALPTIVDFLQKVIEKTQQFRRHREVADLAMSPGAHPQLAWIAQVVEGERRLEAALIQPVAPDEDANAASLDLRCVRRDARFAPEGDAEEGRNIVAIRHAAPELRHGRACGMCSDRRLRRLAVLVLIDRQHALSEVTPGIFRPRVELRGDAAAAHEPILVEISAAGSDCAQMRRHGCGGMPGRAADIRAACDADCACAPRLRREPLRHVVRVARLRPILKAAAHAEGSAATAGIDRGKYIAMLHQLEPALSLD